MEKKWNRLSLRRAVKRKQKQFRYRSWKNKQPMTRLAKLKSTNIGNQFWTRQAAAMMKSIQPGETETQSVGILYKYKSTSWVERSDISRFLMHTYCYRQSICYALELAGRNPCIFVGFDCCLSMNEWYPECIVRTQCLKARSSDFSSNQYKK